MENFKKIMPLNSAEQNEKLAWYCLEHHEIGRFKRLVQSKMPLTADMLTTMAFFDYSADAIKEVLALVTKYTPPVIQWMRAYFTVEELADVLPHCQDNLPNDWPTDEECVQLKLWETLYQRRKFDLVAQNAPEFLEKDNRMAYSDVCIALLRRYFAKYAPLMLQQKRPGVLLYSEDGWKYLVDNGMAPWLLKLGAACGLLPKDEIIDYCLQKGLVEELYREACFDKLLENKRFEVFVKNHSLYWGFLTGYPEEVNWEDLWDYYKDDEAKHEQIIKAAKFNRTVPNCYEFLTEHLNLWGLLRLFI
jgi:hypothetical protein